MSVAPQHLVSHDAHFWVGTVYEKSKTTMDDEYLQLLSGQSMKGYQNQYLCRTPLDAAVSTYGGGFTGNSVLRTRNISTMAQIACGSSDASLSTRVKEYLTAVLVPLNFIVFLLTEYLFHRSVLGGRWVRVGGFCHLPRSTSTSSAPKPISNHQHQ